MFLKQVTYWLQNKWLKLEEGRNLKLGKLVLQLYWGAKLNCCWSCISRAQQHHGAVTARILLADNRIHFSWSLRTRIDSSVSWITEFPAKESRMSFNSQGEGSKQTPSYTLRRLALAEIWLPAVMLVSRQNLQTGGPSSLKMSSHSSKVFQVLCQPS